MKINQSKICISDNKLNFNIKFYFILKNLIKLKLSDKQAFQLYEQLLNINTDTFLYTLSDFKKALDKGGKKNSKANLYMDLIENLDSVDFDVFAFSLQLYMIKDLLLAEAKLRYILNAETLTKYDPLSLAYDKVSLLQPYTTRVNGALLALVFFDNLENNDLSIISEDAAVYAASLSKKAQQLKTQGLEPNQIFMLIFNESINQSIISDSGLNYENRIYKKLITIGIPPESIQKIHDQQDQSTEYDFFFSLGDKKFGIGAKKTLRERYKQFIKTTLSSPIDVIIEITIGLDLTEQKALTIVNHGTILFVSEEIYQASSFLKNIKNIYSTSDLTLDLLQRLANDAA